MQKAAALAARTARERAYIAALTRFFEPGQQDYQARVAAYSAAMGDLYRRYPGDVDAGAFYALSLLAAQKPGDTSLVAERGALVVLNPLFAKYPDHPGVVHYIIHACDTPSLAAQGLAAARHYGEIASSGAHAVHMPGHIFARLGMWPEDIRANLASVAATQAAEERHQSDGMDQFHSDDFLLYAYLQSGEEASARRIVDDTAALMSRYEATPDMMSPLMHGMFPYLRNKFPAFYDLEMRDWKAAASLEPTAGGGPEDKLVTYWARVVAKGHLHEAGAAHADFERRESLMEEVRHGENAYLAQSTHASIARSEMLAWIAFAERREADALKEMREAADLQDKVGQAEVDIPAREMLGDMLLEFQHPQAALIEYERALELSPKRFNGLFEAGKAAEASGDREKAANFYSALLESTDQGAHSVRPEIGHARMFIASAHVAAK
jgi:tetratricopeptide (TPR) repeat protein